MISPVSNSLSVAAAMQQPAAAAPSPAASNAAQLPQDSVSLSSQMHASVDVDHDGDSH